MKTISYAFSNRLAGECIYPFYGSYKVTHKCSLKCEFCNVWMEDTPDLKKEDVFKVLDNIANSSIIVLSIEGGDPLVRKDLGEILEYAYKKPFVLFFTTNGHLLDKRPMQEYGKNIDYLHISIDEGHDNLEFFERLEEFQSYGPEICIQIVVTRDTINALEDKVKKIYNVGARTVVMPACHLDNTDDFYPDSVKFKDEIIRLKKKYKNGDELRYLLVKILLNSFYGKLIQVTEKYRKDGHRYFEAGYLFNPIYASVITANTRIKVSELSYYHDSAIVAVHTDSVILTTPIEDLSPDLGEWSHVVSGDGVVVGSGVYQINGNIHYRGYTNIPDLSDLILGNKGKLKLDVLQKLVLSWRLVAFRGADINLINRFIEDDPKTLNLNFDTKRDWLGRWRWRRELVPSQPFIMAERHET